MEANHSTIPPDIRMGHNMSALFIHLLKQHSNKSDFEESEYPDMSLEELLATSEYIFCFDCN
jgi:hypothetical protein